MHDVGVDVQGEVPAKGEGRQHEAAVDEGDGKCSAVKIFWMGGRGDVGHGDGKRVVGGWWWVLPYRLKLYSFCASFLTRW